MFQNKLSSLGSFQGIELESDISVITLEDNINHTYCSKIRWEKDNGTPIGAARLIMPYDEQIAKYWIKYAGAVVIHANLGSYKSTLSEAIISNFPNTKSLNLKKYEENVDQKKDSKNKIHIKNDEFNYSFIGKVARFKQTGKTFIVYLEDLGWKFMQKVPKDFRNSYIAGQSLDNAFQAICEFMGVEFAYSIEDLSEYKFAADGYSIEKDGEIVENVETVLSEWFNNEEEEEEEKTEDEKMADSLQPGVGAQLSGLQEYNQQNQTNQSTNQSTSSLNSQITNQTDNQTTPETQEENNTSNEKIEQYQQEFDDKIKDLFIGNTLYDSNISDPILNYNWITITPQAPVAETPATTPTDDTSQTNNENEQAGNQETNNEVTE